MGERERERKRERKRTVGDRSYLLPTFASLLSFKERERETFSAFSLVLLSDSPPSFDESLAERREKPEKKEKTVPLSLSAALWWEISQWYIASLLCHRLCNTTEITRSEQTRNKQHGDINKYSYVPSMMFLCGIYLLKVSGVFFCETRAETSDEEAKKTSNTSIMIMIMVLSRGSTSDEESNEEIYHSSPVQCIQMHWHERHSVSNGGERERGKRGSNRLCYSREAIELLMKRW